MPASDSISRRLIWLHAPTVHCRFFRKEAYYAELVASVLMYITRRRDGTAQVPCGLDPLADDDLDVRQCLVVGRAVSGAAGQFGNLGDECLILLAPIENNLVPDV